jgi:hypothetical protein
MVKTTVWEPMISRLNVTLQVAATRSIESLQKWNLSRKASTPRTSATSICRIHLKLLGRKGKTHTRD